MRAPSLYTYFPSKDAIYDAMFAEGYAALDEAMRGVIEREAGSDPVDVLTAGLVECIEFCQASPARYQLMFTRAVPGWEPSAEAYAVSVGSYERSIPELAALGIRSPESLDMYTAIVAGLAAQQMANEPTGDRWRRLARPTMEMLLEYLRKGAP